MQLEDHLRNKKAISGWQKPQVFNLADKDQQSELNQLFESGKVYAVSDQIEAAISELFDMEHPEKKDSKTPKEVAAFAKQITGDNFVNYGNWVYFPWSGSLVHFPPKEDLRRLRGSRNRNLVTEEERQKMVQDKTIVILGLSVGSNVVEALLTQGIGSRYILVDMDHLDPTNLNRIHTSYDQVGVHKVDIVAKKISELDPYIEQVHYRDGIHQGNLDEILTQYSPDIIVDEMDSLEVKLMVRAKAKELAKPVLMATDDGENAIIDIERYDQDPELQPFHGRIPGEILEQVRAGSLPRAEAGKLIGKYFVGPEHIPLKMFQSLVEVGKTLPSWPQLGSAATLSGLLVAYAAKKILLNQPLNNDRYICDLDLGLDPVVQSQEYQEAIKKYKQMFAV